MTDPISVWRRLACALVVALLTPALAAQTPTRLRNGDYIVAVVNQELVTAAELEGRMARIRAEAEAARQPLPPPEELRQQVLDQLINERVQVTNARENGPKIDEAELDRAVASVATQNQMTLPQLRQRLRQEGVEFSKFRDHIRDQLLVERVREREVAGRIRVTDAEIDAFIAERRAAAGMVPQLNIAQILVTVPEGASDAVVAERRARAEAARARVRAGEDFGKVAREMSEDGNRAEGGTIGLRPADRLPDVFVNAVKDLQPGEVTQNLLRSDAGFHLLKLLERKDVGNFTIEQTHVRHILLRNSDRVSQETSIRRLNELKRAIESGSITFEQAARRDSEDGSAANGGDLGWVAPGAFVPEFEDAMDKLKPGGLSDPVITRFGVHLVQVLERRTINLDPKQQREQARNVLREQKFEEAYNDWIRDLRGRAYVEFREPPL
jgi:peptidyl-prolyl cis-trans isomerase SurA